MAEQGWAGWVEVLVYLNVLLVFRGWESLLVSTLAKAKGRKKSGKALGYRIQDAGSQWDVKFSIGENECPYCDDRL